MDIITLAMQIPLLAPYVGYLGMMIAAAAIIARFLDAPDEGSSRAYKTFYNIVNKLGQNAGKATNADDVKKGS